MLFLLPFLLLAALTSLLDEVIARRFAPGKLSSRIGLAFGGFLLFGIGIGMAIGKLLPKGFLTAWGRSASYESAFQVALIVFAWNFAMYFLVIPVSNLFKVKSLPMGLLAYWTLAWGWGMTVASGSLATPEPLTLAQSLAGFAHITLWEFLAGALACAATFNRNLWIAPGWLTNGRRVEGFTYRLSKCELAALLLGLGMLAFAAWQEALAVAQMSLVGQVN